MSSVVEVIEKLFQFAKSARKDEKDIIYESQHHGNKMVVPRLELGVCISLSLSTMQLGKHMVLYQQYKTMCLLLLLIQNHVRSSCHGIVDKVRVEKVI